MESVMITGVSFPTSITLNTRIPSGKIHPFNGSHLENGYPETCIIWGPIQPSQPRLNGTSEFRKCAAGAGGALFARGDVDLAKRLGR